MLLAAGVVLLGSAAVGLQLAELLSDGALAQTLLSPGLWKDLVAACGGKVIWRAERPFAEVETAPLVASTIVLGGLLWLVGSAALAALTGRGVPRSLADFGWWGWLWWLSPVVFGILDLAGGLGWLGSGFPILLRGTLPFWNAMLIAGWLATWVALVATGAGPASELHSGANPHTGQPLRWFPTGIPWSVWGAMALFTTLFTWMNWRLYDALLLPHGDSAMYEEHLWNLLHGKGFRSYLDNGRLFLGEHVQIVHLLLVPVYLLWPSHLLLELVQTAALAAGAIPVFQLTLRATGGRRAAVLLAVAYLLYFPLQFLDIAIDLKTFRPNGFEIPCLLFALDALETGARRRCAVWLLLALSCQEDAATVIAPLGLWIACGWSAHDRPLEPTARRRARREGLGLATLGVVWVLLVIKVILPWFRGGADVHFAQYFSTLGDSTDSIVATVLKHPLAVVQQIVRPESGLFALALLAPLGGIPLLSPTRLAVGAPLFAILCLSEITDSPQHHFHAPLVPILFWAAAHGLRRGARWATTLSLRFGIGGPPAGHAPDAPPVPVVANGRTLPTPGHAAQRVPAGTVLGKLLRRRPRTRGNGAGSICLVPTATWIAVSAAVTGFWIGLSPASLAFWDPHSNGYWQKLYVPGERARQFPRVLEQIPPTARVASTDLIHPRFTHHERSYDYSSYRPVVPEDCEYIVIDVYAPGSEIRGPGDVKELREEPHRWRLLPDQTDGHFLILQRIPQ